MQTTSNSNVRPGRRALSVFLSFLMVLSAVSIGFVFDTSLLPKAEALTSQSAGSYYIKVTAHDTDKTTRDSCNNSAGYMVVPTRKQDGTDGSTWSATVTAGQWDSDGGTWTYTSGAATGFPKHLRKVQTNSATATDWIKNKNRTWTSNIEFKIYVSSDNSNWTEVLSYSEDTSAGGSWSYTNGVDSSKYPTLNSVGISGETTVYTTGSTQSTYTVTSAKDQYGVNWGFSSVSWASSHSAASINSSGVATFGYNNGNPYDVTFTPTLNNAAGGKSKNTISVHVVPCEPLTLNTEKVVTQSAGKYFSFTPSSSGKYIFFTYDSDNTPDPYLHVYPLNNGALGTDTTKDDIGDNKIRELLSGSQDNMGSWQSYVTVDLTAGTTYIVHDSRTSSSSTYPMKVCKAVDITFDAAGGATTFTKTLPAGHTLYLGQTGLTRTDHTMIGWCATAYDYQRREPREYTAAQTITVPNSDTTFVALWNPTDPTAASINTDITASVGAAYQITYYKFTPSETRKYIFYSKATSGDQYGVLYKAADWANSGTIFAYDDDSGNANNFSIKKELTKDVVYLLGVKYYGTSTGSYPFRIEPVYDVTYDANGGTGAPSDQEKFVDVDLTLSTTEPTRDYYTFKGWDTNSAGTTVVYAAGDTYDVNADLDLYAVWEGNTYAVTLDNGNATDNGTSAVYERYADGIYKTNSNGTLSNKMTASANNITIPKREYTVSYDFGGGNGTATDAQKKATYAFKGYYDGSTQMINSTGYITSSFTNTKYTTATTLNADWTSASVTLPSPGTKTGYTFDGWYTNSGFTGTKYSAGTSYTPTANTSFYAKWTINKYTVTFVDEDGTTVLKAATEYDYGTPAADIVKPADPTKAATAQYTYTFSGWSPTIADVTQDVTYTATYSSTVNKYTVTFVDEDGTTVLKAATQYNYGTPAADIVKPADPTKAATAQYTYTFSGWSPTIAEVTQDVTYTATYSSTVNKYTVTFVDEDGTTVLKAATEYDYGTAAADIVKPADPTKAATAEWTYTFAGWTPAIANVTTNATYRATYTATKNKYTVTFVDEDGTTVLKAATQYNYGTAAADIVKPADPTKAATAQYTYTFSGWSPAISAVTGNVTYTATYTSVVNKYTVTWKNADGTVLETDENVPYGDMPEYNGTTPTKEATVQYTYTFATWNPAVTTVTGNATYNATYTETLRSYNVTFMNDAVELQSGDVAYGAKPSYTGATPTKAADVQYTYTFDGWTVTNNPTGTGLTVYATADIPTVNGVATYYAHFSKTVNKYDITFVDEDGTTVLKAATKYDYGTPAANISAPSTPTKAATAQYTYTFAGWSPALAQVTGNQTYRATYSGTVNQYTVSYANGNATSGTLPANETKDYGQSVTVGTNAMARANASGVNITTTFDQNYTGKPANTSETTVVDISYTPNGWNTAADGNGTAYANGATYTFDDDHLSMTLYPDFTANAAFPNVTTPDPTRTGYNFAGWYDTPECDGAKIADGNATITPQESKTYYAKWTAIWYDITYVLNGGTNHADNPLKYTTEQSVTLKNPTKTGYIFDGWTPSGSIPVGSIGDKTFTATWHADQVKYTVNHYLKDLGENTYTLESTVDTDTAEADSAFTLADAQKTYTGFSYDHAEVNGTAATTATVAADGSLVFDLYYVRDTYTVTWKNDNGSTLETDAGVEYGAAPEYNGSAPEKTADAQYTYTWNGWTPEITNVSRDITYSATYASTVNKYDVTFVDEDGTVLKAATKYDYGTAAADIVKPADPTKDATAQYTYTFAGWSPEIAEVTGDATYTATYSATVNKYDVTFVDEDGTVLKAATKYDYGTAAADIVKPADPAKDATAQYTYTFSGWSPAIAEVTGDATYTATYSATVNKYTVTWKNEDGTVLETDENVPYGETPEYNGSTPAKTADAQYTYTFAAWNPAVSSVTGDAVYTATFDPHLRSYTITWNNWDGTFIKSDTVNYGVTPVYSGDTPTRARTQEFTYTFDGWDPAVVSVTGPATYTAQYRSATNQYTATFDANGGSAADPASVTKDYNTAIGTLPATGRTGYRFDGWFTDAEEGEQISAETKIVADVTYYAHWTIIDYVISYDLNDENGDSKATNNADNPATYTVETATFTIAAPTRSGYTFKGWTGDDTTITKGSTGARNYTATWEIIDYVISYDLNDNDGDSKATNNADNPGTYTVETATFTIAAPTRSGYTFTGWTGDNTTIAKGSTGNKSYTAGWSKDTYTITYDLNDISTAGNPEQVNPKTGYTVEDESFTLVNPTLNGYTFMGWTGANGETPETTVTIEKGITGNKSYKANWQINNYTIGYELDGGTVNGNNPTSYTVEDGAITLFNPTKNGYDFTGWTGTDITGSSNSVTIPAGSTGNRNFTATWNIVNYSISYDLDNPSETTTPVHTDPVTGYNVNTETFDLVNPTLEGYTFAGWTGSNGDTPATRVTITKGSTGNKEYTAHWTPAPVSYTVEHYKQNVA
nr:InlB B-repeat-containing protein [Clostridia bacterium]